MQKTNQEQVKQIENLQKTNTRLVNEMSFLRAQATELIKLIKGNHQTATPQAELADPDSIEEMGTRKDTPETPEKQAAERRARTSESVSLASFHRRN